MLGWFLFSALLSSYNKIVFGHNKHDADDGDDDFPNDGGINTTTMTPHDNSTMMTMNATMDKDDNEQQQRASLAFPCPLFLTSIHFLAQWIFSETLCALWPRYWGSHRISKMTWREYWAVSLPCGLVTSADIGLSNLSYVTLSLTFYTLIKSSTPIFVMLWARIFGLLERGITIQLVAVIAIITLGEYVTMSGELNSADFQWSGLILCTSAAILSGARWTLVQLKIQSLQPPLKTTVATMRLLAPSMFVSLFVVSLLLEQPWHRLTTYFMEQQEQQQEQQQQQLVPDLHPVLDNPKDIDQKMTTTTTTTLDLPPTDPTDKDLVDSSYYFVVMVEMTGLGLFGAFFAIAMILCEFYLIMKANAIVLTVGGVVKEVVTILIGVIIFRDSFTWHTFVGCCILFSGVILYKFTFHPTTTTSRRKSNTNSSSSKTDSSSSSSSSSLDAGSNKPLSLSSSYHQQQQHQQQHQQAKRRGSDSWHDDDHDDNNNDNETLAQQEKGPLLRSLAATEEQEQFLHHRMHPHPPAPPPPPSQLSSSSSSSMILPPSPSSSSRARQDKYPLSSNGSGSGNTYGTTEESGIELPMHNNNNNKQ